MATESTEPANCIQPVAPRIGAQAAAEAPPPRESCALPWLSSADGALSPRCARASDSDSRGGL